MQDTQVRRKLLRYAVILVLIFGVACFLWSQLFVHDYLLWQFSRKYAAIRHPAGTHSVKSHKELGLLIGNSNHVDFFVGELRTYSGPRQDLVKAYAGQEFVSPSSGDRIRVQVLFTDKGKLSYAIPFPKGSPTMECKIGWDLPYPVDKLLNSKYDQTAEYYIVYIFDAGYRVGIDIRGC